MAKSHDDINATDYDGNTALHMAACAGNQAIVEQLLTPEGINVTLKDYTGRNALQCAVDLYHHNTAAVIISYMNNHNISVINDEVADDEIAIDLRGADPGAIDVRGPQCAGERHEAGTSRSGECGLGGAG